jgi:dephospho-CoA kinase
MKRDGLSREEVMTRMTSQMDAGEGLEYADLVIANAETDLVIPQVLKADKIIRDLA